MPGERPGAIEVIQARVLPSSALEIVSDQEAAQYAGPGSRSRFATARRDIHIELPITLSEAVLGARVETPTPTGAVMLSVPKGSNTGTILRLKGKGAPRRGGHGDELVKLKVMLPSEPNAELEAFLATWTPGASYDPRKGMQP